MDLVSLATKVTLTYRVSKLGPKYKVARTVSGTQ